jgi:uncharacterized protein YcbK (DUF882 family)
MTGLMTDISIPRRSLIIGVAAAACTLSAPSLLFAKTSQRRLRFYSINTNEHFDRVYHNGSNYVQDALDEFNWFARDWRKRKSQPISKKVMNTAFQLQDQIGSNKAMHFISGYRTPQTNRNLRGTAKQSYHVKGMALDVRQPGLSTSRLYKIAWKLQRGGVGKYTKSNFIHIDSANVRTWGS